MIDFSCQDKTPHFSKKDRLLLEKKKIVVIGIGGLGTTVSELLVRSGAKNIVLIDDDVVESSNLPRQTLFVEKDIGSSKVSSAKHHLEMISSDINISVFNDKLSVANAFELLDGSDLVLGCTDSINSRFLIDDVCKKLGVSWVHASVVRVFGELMIISNSFSNSVTYRDFIDVKKPAYNCSDRGVLGSACFITASFQVSFALKFLAGKADDLVGRVFRINSWTGVVESFSVSKGSFREIKS